MIRVTKLIKYSINVTFLLFLLKICYIGCFDLTILHDNDVHARFVSYTKFGTPCSGNGTEECYGGSARRLTLAKRLRAKHSNTIYLSAGDDFQGTVYYNLFKGELNAEIMNALGYTAMALGNHEFDDGVEGLVPFVNLTKFPIIATNVKASETELDGKFVDHLILEFGGEKIGILGYTTPTTASSSSPGPLVHFEDEIAALIRGVELVKSKGVNKIIAVGHSGIEVDESLCAKVEGIDVVVGGHTNTFLYTGDTLPAQEQPYGPYPVVINDTGSPCLVVSSFAYGKYMGFLQVTFDALGQLTHWGGNPILVTSELKEDPTISAILKPLIAKVESYRMNTLTTSAVALGGEASISRSRETNLGNLLLDIVVELFMRRSLAESIAEGYWTDVSIAFMNGGGIRDFQCEPGYGLTEEDVLRINPFGNRFHVVQLTGAELKNLFEYSIKDYNPKVSKGHFLQVSGIRVVYDISKPNGERVVSLEALCANCSVPEFKPVIPNLMYKVATTTYMRNGGDGYKMLVEKPDIDASDAKDAQVLDDYFASHPVIAPKIEGRITFTKKSETIETITCGGQLASSAPENTGNLNLKFICILLGLLNFWFIKQ